MALAVLRAECGLTPVVVPLPTTQGQFTSHLAAASTVVVFPFVDGTTAYDISFSEPHGGDWPRSWAICMPVVRSAESRRCRARHLPIPSPPPSREPSSARHPRYHWLRRRSSK